MEINNIPKMIFIIPYRDRQNQLIHFKHYIKYILEDIPDNEYKIYFIHQNNNYPFNRGAIKNIGFLAMKAKYPNDYKNITFIFNDIDTMPYTKNLLNYKTHKGNIKHFYGYPQSLGGIVSITGEDFENLNGFANYWGWGFEDNALQERAIINKINIDRSNFYNYTSPEILNIKDEKTRIYSKQQIWRVGFRNKAGIKEIQNLNYEINDDMGFVKVNKFTTEINPLNDNYYKDINRPNVIADDRFIPDNAINSVNDIKKSGHVILRNKTKFNRKGLGMKLF